MIEFLSDPGLGLMILHGSCITSEDQTQEYILARLRDDLLLQDTPSQVIIDNLKIAIRLN